MAPKKLHPEAHRIERAENLMTFWAWHRFRESLGKTIEFSSGYSGESVLLSFSGGNEYKPFCFKIKTNAKQTREKRCSEEPLGGGIGGYSKRDYAYRVERLWQNNFPPKQIMLLMGLHLPPEAYGATKKLTDAKISRIFQFKPARACQIKFTAMRLVVTELLSPNVTN